MASLDFDTAATLPATATADITVPPQPTSYHNLPYTRPVRTYEGAFLGPRRPRQVTDYGSSLVQWMGVRRPPWKGNGSLLERERPSMSFVVDMLPPSAAQYSAVDTIPVRHLHHSVGKSKKPITVVRWTPEGRRLLTGGHTGEFMLWNGMAFNFETVMDAHYDQYKAGVTSAEWSWNRDWLISGGQKGDIKYWRPNFNNVETIDEAHHDAVRDLAWSPRDTKFLSASDDTTLKIFDFNSCQSELVLTGHGWDVKACDWHPAKGLLVSGSKDHQVKFWDPRTGRCLTTLHSHKNTVTATKFSCVNRNLLATSSRDQTARVFDLRMMRDICVLRGNKGPISSLTWHPIHGNLISTGSEDGSLSHYLLDEPNLPPGHVPTTAPYDTLNPSNTPPQIIFPAHRIEKAHEFTIWSLDWHPLGHILASGSKDTNTHFWSRARPGETAYMTDVYHIGKEAAEELGTWSPYGRHQAARREEEQEAQDEADSLVDQKRPESIVPGIQPPPSLQQQQQQSSSSASHLGGGGIPGLIPGIGAPQSQPTQQQQQQQAVPPPFPCTGTLPPGTTNQQPATPPPPPPPPGVANIDPSRLAAMLTSGAFNNGALRPSSTLPPPPLPASAALMGLRPGTGTTIPPFPPPNTHLSFPTPPPPPPAASAPASAAASASASAPAPTSLSILPGMMGVGIPGLPGLGGDQQQQQQQYQQSVESFGSGNGVRRRGPLPTQRDSLVEEQRRGNYRAAR